MHFKTRSRLFVVCIFYFFYSGGLIAADSQTVWNNWLIRQIETHPDIIAARERMNAALSMSEARRRPLYNPELETEFEREGQDNNFRIGFSQTVDWWDKRGTRKQQALAMKIAARQTFQLTYQDKLAQALRALVTWQATKERYQLAVEQEKQLDTLISLVKNLSSAGDLGQLDVELTLLSLSQKLNETAQAMAEFKSAEALLHELLPAWTPAKADIPESLWQAGTVNLSPDWLDAHPSVVAAKAQWEMRQKQADLARLNAKADPTFGVTAGRNMRNGSDDNVIGLTVSIPLNVRNNFSAQVRAAHQEALAALANYRAIRRQQKYAIEASVAVAQLYSTQINRWQSLMAQSRDQSKKLLDKQWRTGDLSTNEYLLALQQRIEGLMAGITLREQYRLTVIDRLSSTGRVVAHLTQVSPLSTPEQ